MPTVESQSEGVSVITMLNFLTIHPKMKPFLSNSSPRPILLVRRLRPWGSSQRSY